MRRLLLPLIMVATAACTESRAADSAGPVTLTNLCVQTGGVGLSVDTALTCQMTALKRHFSSLGSCYVVTVENCTETVTANAQGLGTAITKLTFIAGDSNTQESKWFAHVGMFFDARQLQSKEITVAFKGIVAQPDPTATYYYVDNPNGQMSLE